MFPSAGRPFGAACPATGFPPETVAAARPAASAKLRGESAPSPRRAPAAPDTDDDRRSGRSEIPTSLALSAAFPSLPSSGPQFLGWAIGSWLGAGITRIFKAGAVASEEPPSSELRSCALEFSSTSGTGSSDGGAELPLDASVLADFSASFLPRLSVAWAGSTAADPALAAPSLALE